MTPLDLAALTFTAWLGSGESRRVFGIILIVIGVFVAVGTLGISQQTGYTSVQKQIDSNTIQTTVTYTYTSAPNGLNEIIGLSFALVGIYLLIAPNEVSKEHL